MWIDYRTTSSIKMGTDNAESYFTATTFLDRVPGRSFTPIVVNEGLMTTYLNIDGGDVLFIFLILSIIADIQFSLETSTRLSFKLPTESHTGKH